MNSRLSQYRYVLLGLLAFSLISQVGETAELRGRFSSEFYSYSDGEDEHLRPYQRLASDLIAYRSKTGMEIAWHTTLRWTSDLVRRQPGDPELFIRQSYLRFSGLLKRTELRIGRQFVYDGLSSGLVDGIGLTVRPTNDLDLNLHTGSSVDWFNPETIRSFSDWMLISGRVNYRLSRTVRLSALWNLEKSEGDLADHRLGLAGHYRSDQFSGYGRVVYDPLSRRLATIYGRLKIPLNAWQVSIEGGSRTPRVRLNSIFSIIDAEKQKDVRFNLQRSLIDDWRATGSIKLSLNQANKATRTTLGLKSNRYHLIWTNQSGAQGDNNGLRAGLNRTIYQSLNLYLSGGYNSYMVQAEAESKLVAWYLRAGLSRKINKSLRASAEVQLLSNADFKTDRRLLIRISKAFSLGLNNE